jgi:hypothetical protein
VLPLTLFFTDLQVGIRQGLVTGMSLGGLNFVLFGAYAVSLYYGCTRVAAGAMTGGSVLAVMMAALVGSFSLGQVTDARSAVSSTPAYVLYKGELSFFCAHGKLRTHPGFGGNSAIVFEGTFSSQEKLRLVV